ncbi:hypothetical protein BST61_g4792 [Cercospora zeina]
MGLGRSCSGNPRIQWPIRYPRHFECRFNTSEHCVDLSRYDRDWIVTHEYIDQHTQVLAIPQPHECRSPEQPALTRVCRSIRNEALPMFYGQNRFVFTPKVTLVDGIGQIAEGDVHWLQAIGVKHTSLIRMIEVKWLGWCRKASLAAYKDGLRETGLGVDRIQVQISCWNDDRWSSGFPSVSLQSITA